MFSAANANSFAYIALLAIFPIAWLIFGRVRAPVAAFVVILIGDMFLPTHVGFDLPGLPVLGKRHLPFIAVLVCLLLKQPGRITRGRFGFGLEFLGIAMSLGSIGTVLTNQDTLVYGPRTIEGLSILEWFTATIDDLLIYTVPFFLGRILFQTSRDLRDLMRTLACAGLVYSLIIVVELQLSPQFHRWTYGFHPNIFSTVNRWGGYRPMAYFVSGIALAVFMVTTLIAAAALRRAGVPAVTSPRIPLRGMISRYAQIYLTGIVIACKSVASMVWGAFFSASIAILPVRVLAHIALALSLLVIFYPAVRTARLLPIDTIVEVAKGFDEQRAASLNYRFENEERMLAHGRDRFIFGWGGYSRNWVYDAVTGDWLSVPDGYWIIQLGGRGLVGFLTAFGLYVLPVWSGWRRFGRIPRSDDRILVAGLMLIVIVRAVDQLPNGFYSSYPIFVAGALYNLAGTLSSRGKNSQTRSVQDDLAA